MMNNDVLVRLMVTAIALISMMVGLDF